ncbi:hypothetical protein SAMN04487897_10260 [Paenibacillus sp. yr247]|uniref:hypothetical protein n=1 Tax=Paenibacillus sp. yr247 TaxID=1761880 RepID=UPI00088258F7|nr:hypothetical protein [Paenibacillus sp. yr247]SDN18602.1 hypothetical protein SAMN04487897_10260 [Paenibacillus sp. yr247]
MEDKLLTSNDLKVINKWMKKLKEKYYNSKNKRNIARSELKLPYEEIGAGLYRIVFDLKNGFVLKVAVSKTGIKNNKNEAEIYKKFKSSLRSHLAKVIDHGYGWIIMEKVDQKVSQNDENREKVLKLRKKFLRRGMRASDIISSSSKEPKWKNIRYREKDNLIIFIDYGPFRY